jgi:hypothetical protein
MHQEHWLHPSTQAALVCDLKNQDDGSVSGSSHHWGCYDSLRDLVHVSFLSPHPKRSSVAIGFPGQMVDDVWAEMKRCRYYR